MTCPTCYRDDDVVIKTRDHGVRVYRRRKCKACGARFTTVERRGRVIASFTEIDERRGSQVGHREESRA